MKIIFATGNKGKLREAAEILGEGYELVTPADMGITEDIPETGDTLKENSIQKASYLYERLHVNCFADDTGLMVDALGGAPGVHSARYATDGHDFDANIVKLLSELEKVGANTPEQRTARFMNVVTLIIDGEMHFFEGVVEGHIALSRNGSKGFGYDPVFIPDAFPGQTMAELGEEVKNSISHRGMSLRAMATWLKENVGE
ncbi:MAG: RdgB/HAM1 family non-canonical purine NTP pyrophosphatase [Bacteroidales bacterium]|nr:RdgB/HAM1 family non-canonical purine NTP pyrophosphatase [Bacteroidales bacterium]